MWTLMVTATTRAMRLSEPVDSNGDNNGGGDGHPECNDHVHAAEAGHNQSPMSPGSKNAQNNGKDLGGANDAISQSSGNINQQLAQRSCV